MPDESEGFGPDSSVPSTGLAFSVFGPSYEFAAEGVVVDDALRERLRESWRHSPATWCADPSRPGHGTGCMCAAWLVGDKPSPSVPSTGLDMVLVSREDLAGLIAFADGTGGIPRAVRERVERLAAAAGLAPDSVTRQRDRRAARAAGDSAPGTGQEPTDGLSATGEALPS